MASKNRQHRLRRAGFTLLELLIATALMSTLMLVVWSLFRTYTRLEERSAQAAVELQLVRSVSQHLRSDVEHFATLALPAVPVPQPGQKNSNDESTDEGGESTDSSETESEGGSESEASEAVQETAVTSAPVEEPFARSEILPPGSSVGAGDFSTDTPNQFEVPELDRNQLRKPQEFNSSLLETTYLRGSAKRLEIVTRMPHTVDVPTGSQIPGAETRYGTHQIVIYEFRDARLLDTLLREDPILNPSKFNPPPSDPFRDPRLPPAVPAVAQQLNPNENVGLIREAKSWLQYSRDRRMDAMKKQAEAEGLLVDGQMPWEVAGARSPFEPTQSMDQFSSSQQTGTNPLLQNWSPPPEFRHRRDHMPEVTNLQFRYLDGGSWRLDWNNNETLPQAIEVAFDLDPAAPANRAKEFEEAHASMVSGSSLVDVLPPKEDEVEEDMLDSLDSLATLNLDPTAIITEYRFVLKLPSYGKADEEKEQGDSFAEGDGSPDGVEAEEEQL